jgi:hypothetical protein
MAVPFDLRRMEVTGSAVPVAEGVMDTNQDTGAAQAALGVTGISGV